MTRPVLRRLFAAACLAAGALASSQASSTPISSATSLTAGGLTFDSFSCSILKGGFSASPSRCNQIDVAGNAAAHSLDITSSFVAKTLSFDNATIGYRVRSSGGGIDSLQLDFDGAFLGLAVASVTQSVWDARGRLVGLLTVSCSLTGCDKSDPAYGWFDIPLNGVYAELYVAQQINVSGGLGAATISNVRQGFTTAEVPEPGTLALAGLGLAGLAGGRRRKRVA